MLGLNFSVIWFTVSLSSLPGIIRIGRDRLGVFSSRLPYSIWPRQDRSLPRKADSVVRQRRHSQ